MQIACDTHVHCYQFDQLPELLDHAKRNFANLAPDAGEYILFFTDGFVDRTWLKLQDILKSDAKLGEWCLAMNTNSGLIEASKEGDIIHLAPARQVNTAGRLEMLLLGCDQELDDRQAANDLIEKFADDYVLISPWGVGKWLGKRGRVLVDLINHSSKPFFLGDNGGRPFFWPVPHFKCIEDLSRGKKNKYINKTLTIFNGSDPLPISGEIIRVGSYGMLLEYDGDLNLKNILSSMKTRKVENFGKPLGLFNFLIGRLKMAMR